MAAKILSVLLLAFQIGGVSTTPTASTPQPPASIEGRVVRLPGGEPLRRAQLALNQVQSPAELAALPAAPDSEPKQFPPIAPITTEADGRFHFTGLAPGTYRLKVACNGYVSTEYGKTATGQQGTIITLTAGQAMKDVLFQLQPAALVTGHVRDFEGEPIAGISVSLMKSGYDWNGTRTLMRTVSATTDDRGEYRLFWVTPGRYYLSSGAPDFPYFMINRGPNMVQNSTNPRTYYPGTLDSSRAVIIEVQAGQELSALDIVVPKTATYRVKGSIVEAATGKPPKYADVSLIPRKEAAFVEENGQRGPGNVSYVNGDFELSNIIPGSYWLHAYAEPDYDAPLPADAVAAVRTTSDLFDAAFNRGATAEIPVEVNASDVTGLKISLTAGVRVPLRVSMEGKDLSSVKDFEKIRLSLWPRYFNPSSSQGIQRGPLTADGVGTMENVGNGEYRIQIERTGLPDFYIKEASVDDTDVLNGFWQLSGAPKGVLRVVLSDKTGRVDGNLSDAASKPVAGVQVILIPETFRYRTELYKTVDTDEKGRFTFRFVPPGDYRVFAWEVLESNSYYDPEVIKPYEQQSKLIHVTEGSQQTTDIKIIPAPKQ